MKHYLHTIAKVSVTAYSDGAPVITDPAPTAPAPKTDPAPTPDAAAATAAATAAAEAAQAKVLTDNTAPKGDVFSKTEVEAQIQTALTKHDEKSRAEKAELAKELSNFQEQARLTSADNKDLTDRIESLRKQGLTAQQIAAEDATKAETQYAKDLKDAKESAVTWEQRYKTEKIDKAIIDAAGHHNAFDSEQILAILRPKAKLIERKDAANDPTGDFQVRVDLQDNNEDGVLTEFEFSAGDAVNRMTTMTRHMNLFKGAGSEGLNLHQQSSKKADGEYDLDEIIKTNPKLYEKLRNEGKI